MRKVFIAIICLFLAGCVVTTRGPFWMLHDAPTHKEKHMVYRPSED